MDAMTPSVPVQPVQYVPYYYYYPVPAENYSNMNMVDQTNIVNNNIKNVITTNANSELEFVVELLMALCNILLWQTCLGPGHGYQ